MRTQLAKVLVLGGFGSVILAYGAAATMPTTLRPEPGAPEIERAQALGGATQLPGGGQAPKAEERPAGQGGVNGGGIQGGRPLTGSQVQPQQPEGQKPRAQLMQQEPVQQERRAEAQRPPRLIQIEAPETNIRIDPDSGSVRVRAPYTRVDVDPEGGRATVRAPGFDLDVRW